MKKARIAVVALAVLMLFAAVSCKEPEPAHVHEFSKEWTSDATNHWHVCECGEKVDEAAHVYGDPQVKNDKVVHVCDECDYEEEIKGAVAVESEDALNTAIAGTAKTIYIFADITLKDTVKINGGKSVEINLNGKKISGKTVASSSSEEGIKNSLFCIENAKVVFSGNGIIQDTGKLYGGICAVGSPDENVEEYTVVTVNKGVVFKDGIAVWVNKNSSGNYVNHGVIVNFNGTADLPETELYAFFVNGQNKAEKNAPVFNLESAKIVSKGVGIYAAGYAKWNIKDSAIEGVGSAIEIRAGELNIESGEYSASATPTAVAPNGNGTTSSGAAIAVAQHTTKLPISVNISGGVFEGYSALYESNPQGNDAASIAKVKLNVTGGSFNSTASDKKCAVYSEDCIGFVVGGTYNSDPTAYVAAGYKASESEGVWNVVAE